MEQIASMTVEGDGHILADSDSGETWLFGQAPSRLAIQWLECERTELQNLGSWLDIDQPPTLGESGDDYQGGWLYVADRQALENGRLYGRWLPPGLSGVLVTESISAVSGRSLDRSDLAVVDQLGCGPQMVDEDHFTTDPYKQLARLEVEA